GQSANVCARSVVLRVARGHRARSGAARLGDAAGRHGAWARSGRRLSELGAGLCEGGTQDRGATCIERRSCARAGARGFVGPARAPGCASTAGVAVFATWPLVESLAGQAALPAVGL